MLLNFLKKEVEKVITNSMCSEPIYFACGELDVVISVIARVFHYDVVAFILITLSITSRSVTE